MGSQCSLSENWCDVVTAWCEGNYPGNDVLYSLERFSSVRAEVRLEVHFFGPNPAWT